MIPRGPRGALPRFRFYSLPSSLSHFSSSSSSFAHSWASYCVISRAPLLVAAFFSSLERNRKRARARACSLARSLVLHFNRRSSADPARRIGHARSRFGEAGERRDSLDLGPRCDDILESVRESRARISFLRCLLQFRRTDGNYENSRARARERLSPDRISFRAPSIEDRSRISERAGNEGGG